MTYHSTALIVLLTACALPSPAGADLYVALTGSDSNPGTADRPFATLGRAQQAVRQRVLQQPNKDITVWMGEGTYGLAAALVFRPEDGGTKNCAVTYAARPGETVTLSGGRRITGWRRGPSDVWTTSVPAAGQGRQAFVNLFVDGRRAVRARKPNADAQPNCVQLKGAELSDDRRRYTLTLPPASLGNWTNVTDMEVMVAGNWAINRKGVQHVEPTTGVLTLTPPHWHAPNYIFPSAGRWCYLENAAELLDRPGEWYLHRPSGVLSYWPRGDENLASTEIVAPAVTQLLLVQGTPEHPVRNLHFRGIRFAYTDWRLPPGGYMGIQACHFGHSKEPGRRWQHIPAAVSLTDALACSIEDCVLAHLGGSGIELADGCRDCVVQGNHLFDVSANGIMVGGPSIEQRAPSGNGVRNNRVHACGRAYYGAIGIWVGFAQDTRVAHNLIHDLPYTGISVGWQWGSQPTPCKRNRIEFNHVYDVMNRLCDGGCVYTLGYQPGTVVRGNHLHGVHRHPLAQGAPNNGIFIDKGSKGYWFERNVIYDTHGAPLRFNQCQRAWHAWHDNFLGRAAAAQEAAQKIIAKAGLESP